MELTEAYNSFETLLERNRFPVWLFSKVIDFWKDTNLGIAEVEDARKGLAGLKRR